MFRQIFNAAALFVAYSSACPTVGEISPRQNCPDYEYAEQGRDWASQCPAWSLCGSGTQQSPIDLPANSFARTHYPTLNFPGGGNVQGELLNWRFGPQWEPLPGAQVPTLSFDGHTFDLLQWHTHAPSSEHAFGGEFLRMEAHFVFGDSAGVSAVVGVPLVEAGASDFFSDIYHQLDAQGLDLPPPTSQARIHITTPFTKLLSQSIFDHYWTYAGSLTTPDCSQGIRWFVTGETPALNTAQYTRLRNVSPDSIRALQPIIDQHVNV